MDESKSAELEQNKPRREYGEWGHVPERSMKGSTVQCSRRRKAALQRRSMTLQGDLWCYIFNECVTLCNNVLPFEQSQSGVCVASRYSR